MGLHRDAGRAAPEHDVGAARCRGPQPVREPAFADQKADPAARLKQATRKVAANLSVSPPNDGQLIDFTYVSQSPQLAAQVANAYATAFISTTLQRRYEASTYARNFLEKQIGKTRGDLERSERQLVAYAQSQGIINTSSGSDGERGADAGSLQGQSLVALNEALAQATARRVAAEGAYRSGAAAGPTSDVTASTQALRQARASLEAEYQDKRTLMKAEHPEMVSLRSRITELDRQIARETSNVEGSRLNGLQAEYRAALSAENALQARVAGLKGQVLDLRGRSIQYTIYQREVDTNRALYDALLQRYKEIGVAGGVGTAPVSIVDRADVPVSPFKPSLLWNLLAGLILGIGAGIAAAFAFEFVNDTIKHAPTFATSLALRLSVPFPSGCGRSRCWRRSKTRRPLRRKHIRASPRRCGSAPSRACRRRCSFRAPGRRRASHRRRSRWRTTSRGSASRYS